ncbi:hypothetical protein A2Y85_07105 [candidate division WOR-3 bacterium RBG_13_43_14]|uniref:Outer membrane protein beta-barrel domain-containing protein n=1 Tax=candidate division WOR-3 bacterium RBG_13_43_14 TaxID=1802590 RepID=A0A1F4UCW8_UNCW3|nr:MAG: hypothetical protein A2Y85_07105 [candidate division WOR-3 bacterium RBG_13_43_14]
MKRLLISSVLFLSASFSSRFELDTESGAMLVSYSDIQIPKSTGTLISFTDELTTDPAWFIRGRFTYFINNRHSLSVLVAPLTLKASGSVDRDVVFEGVTFPSNAELRTVYKFNSYRLSYQYYWPLGERLKLGLGATAKIRDAAISIEDSSRFSEKTDLGFVPIIRFSTWWNFAGPFSLLLEGDALAAPQGRAEDISVTLQVRISNPITFKAGYRVLEGGSDVEAVYSFTWVNYLLTGLVFEF